MSFEVFFVVVFLINDLIHPYFYDKVQHAFSLLALVYSATFNMCDNEIYLEYLYSDLLAYISFLLPLAHDVSPGTSHSPI